MASDDRSPPRADRVRGMQFGGSGNRTRADETNERIAELQARRVFFEAAVDLVDTLQRLAKQAEADWDKGNRVL